MPNKQKDQELTQLREQLWGELLKAESQPSPSIAQNNLLYSEREIRAYIMVANGDLKGKPKCKNCYGKGYILIHKPFYGKTELGRDVYKPTACPCTVGALDLRDLHTELRLAHEKQAKDQQDKSASGGDNQIGTKPKKSPRKTKRNTEIPENTNTSSHTGREEEVSKPSQEVQETGDSGGTLQSTVKKVRSPRKPSPKKEDN